MILTNKRKAKLSKFFKFKKVAYLPFILNVEPGNICNLHCPLCPTGKDKPGLAKGFMTARREILREKKYACTICGICRDNGFMHM